MNFVVCDLFLCQLQCTDVIAMNILGVFILTLLWGYIRTQSWTYNQKYSQLSGVPDRNQAYQQHLPSQESAVLSEEQRIWLENIRSPQIAQTAPIRHYGNVNSLPLRPHLNEKPAILNNINEPYNLPQQINLDLKKIQNTPVLQEPYRQNVLLQDVLFPKVKYIQQTPESINYPKRNQEVSNTPLRQKFDVQQIISDPKIRKVLRTEEQKKRYMVFYPDGRVSHVDNVDSILKSNPVHILINSKDLASSKIEPNFLRQTENSELSDPQNLKRNPTEQNVPQNPIDIILNETLSTSTSEPLKNSKSNPLIVVQSLKLQPNTQSKPIQTSTESNKIQPFQVSSVEGDQRNVTNTSTNLTLTLKNNNQTTESSIVLVNPIDNISSPILNSTAQIGNKKTSNESKETPEKSQSLEEKVLKNKLDENKVSNASEVKSSIVKTTQYSSEKDISPDNSSSVLTTLPYPELPKTISEEKDSETLDNNSNSSVPSSNFSQPSDDNDDISSEKYSNESRSEQSKSEEEKEINSSTGNASASDAENQTQEDECGNNSDLSLETSKNQTQEDESGNKSDLSLETSKNQTQEDESGNKSDLSLETSKNQTQEDESGNKSDLSLETSKNQTQEDESGNKSDLSLETSKEQDEVYPGVERNSANSPKGKGKVTSQNGDAWKKVTVEKDDFDIVYSFNLPLQPISLVDSYGETHPCLQLLDPTAMLTYIICQ